MMGVLEKLLGRTVLTLVDQFRTASVPLHFGKPLNMNTPECTSICEVSISEIFLI